MISLRPAVSPVRLRIAVGGDVCPGPLGSALAREGKAADVFAPLAPFLRDADLRLVQFETPLPSAPSPIAKTGPALASAPESADTLRGLFDVALLANNHVGDHGPQGVLDTIRELRSRGLRTVGAGAGLEEAAAPLRLEAAGRPVSVLNFAEHEFGIAEDGVPGVAPQRPDADVRAVAAERDAGRTVVVVLHGGHEHCPFPSPRLRDLCRAFADAGASFVVNCHSHCPLGVEWHGATPIVYGPGNLWFPPRSAAVKRPPLWRFGYLAKALFDDRGPFAVGLLPYEQGTESVHPLCGAMRKAFLGYLGRISAPLSDPARLQALFEAWCATAGRTYLRDSASALPPDWLADAAPGDRDRAEDDPVPFLQMRNLFTCESHRDLVRTYLLLVAGRRLGEAARLTPEIDALRNPDWALRTAPPPSAP